MNSSNQFQLRHLVLLAGAALWGAATPLAAQDAPTISVSDATVVKPTGAAQSAEFVVTRGGDTSDPITVGYRTQDGTAKAGMDYLASRGVVTIPAGETSAKIQVPVLPGQKAAQQNFVLQLTGASGPLVLGADLAARPDFETGKSFSNDAIPADFNGDGRLDIAGIDEFNTVSVFLNTAADGGLPSFVPRISLPFDDFPYFVGAADFNGDGKADLAIGVRNDKAIGDRKDTIAVLINSTPESAFTPQFAEPIILSSGTNSSSIAVADFDGDGKPDIVVANLGIITSSGGSVPFNSYSEFNVSVLTNTTSRGAVVASFTDPEESSDLLGAPSSVIATDVNGDGKTDLVLSSATSGPNDASGVFFLLNTTNAGAKTPSFMPASTVFFGNRGVGRMTAADLNNDGLTELLFNNQIFVNTTPKGALLPSFDAPTAAEGFAVAADINADGWLDLVTFKDGRSSVLLNETIPGNPPSFAAPADYEFGFVSSSGDLNGDGKHELITRIALNSDQDSLLVGILPFGPANLSKAQGVGTIQANADTTPARFSFIDRFGVARGQPLVSNVVLVRGINQPAPIKVDGGSYSINNGPYVIGQGLVNNGDRVRVALFSAGQFNAAANAQLTIGGVSDVFTTRTRGPLLDVFLSRLFGFDFLNQGGFAIAGLTGSAMP